MKTSRVCLLVLAVLLSACGTDGAAAVDTFIHDLAAEKCAWEFRCCTDPEIKARNGRKFTTTDECIPYVTLELENQLYLGRLAAKEGRLRVDGDAARACIEQKQHDACKPKPGA